MKLTDIQNFHSWRIPLSSTHKKFHNVGHGFRSKIHSGSGLNAPFHGKYLIEAQCLKFCPFVHFIRDLSGNSFFGTLPRQWKHADELRIIDLARNSLSGTLEKEWKDLKNTLEFLDLSSNSMTGYLQDDLKELSLLTTLWVSAYRDIGEDDIE